MNNLVDEYNNTYRRSSGRSTVNGDYSALTGKIESSHKAPKFKVGEKVNITNYKNIFNRRYNKHWSKGIFVIEKQLLLSIL